MHKSVILGIIGCCVALISGVGLILGGVWMDSMFTSPYFSVGMPDEMFSDMLDSMFIIYYVAGGIAAACVIPGVIGCVLFKKNRKTAGILFIVAAVLSILTAFISGVLFILAGIFALSKEKPAVQPAMGAPWPPPYPSPYPSPPAYGAYPPPYGAQPAPPQYPPYGAQPAPPPPPSGSTETKEQ